MKHFLPAIFWGISILLLSTVGGVSPPKIMPELLEPDKLAHTVAYAILTTLLIWGFVRNGSYFWQAARWSTGIGITYGVSMEIVQYSFFPNRYFEVWDIVANIIGCLISILVSYFVIK